MTNKEHETTRIETTQGEWGKAKWHDIVNGANFQWVELFASGSHIRRCSYQEEEDTHHVYVDNRNSSPVCQQFLYPTVSHNAAFQIIGMRSPNQSINIGATVRERQQKDTICPVSTSSQRQGFASSSAPQTYFLWRGARRKTLTLWRCVSTVANIPPNNGLRYIGSHSPRIILRSTHPRISLFCILRCVHERRECFTQF